MLIRPNNLDVISLLKLTHVVVYEFLRLPCLSQAMHGAPLYIAETSPSQIRGTLISLKELFIVLGILVDYLTRLKFVGSFFE